MLVSAAIDPYRKSYGNARSRSAMAAGNRPTDRMTASPRNTWVPGVHAYAAAGVRATTTTAMTTTSATYLNANAGSAEPLPERFKLPIHGTVDRLASRLDVLSQPFLDVVAVRERVEPGLAALAGPGCRIAGHVAQARSPARPEQ